MGFDFHTIAESLSGDTQVGIVLNTNLNGGDTPLGFQKKLL